MVTKAAVTGCAILLRRTPSSEPELLTFSTAAASEYVAAEYRKAYSRDGHSYEVSVIPRSECSCTGEEKERTIRRRKPAPEVAEEPSDSAAQEQEKDTKTADFPEEFVDYGMDVE